MGWMLQKCQDGVVIKAPAWVHTHVTACMKGQVLDARPGVRMPQLLVTRAIHMLMGPCSVHCNNPQLQLSIRP